MSGYHFTLLSGYNVTLLTGYNVTLLPGYNVTLLSGYHFTLLPGYNVTLLSGYNVTLLSGYNVTLLSGLNVTLLPDYFPPFKTVTESFSTEELMIKKSILPVIIGRLSSQPNYRVTRKYSIRKIVNPENIPLENIQPRNYPTRKSFHRAIDQSQT